MESHIARYRFYKGKPVKRLRVVNGKLILTMLAANSGEHGTQITVSQADWNLYGEWRNVNAVDLDSIRKLNRMHHVVASNH